MTTEATSQAFSIDDFPPEVQLGMIDFLHPQDKLRLRQTSKRWLALVHSCPALRSIIHLAGLKGLAMTFNERSLFCCGGTAELAHPLRLSFNKKVAAAEGGEKFISGFLSFPLCAETKEEDGRGRSKVEEVEGEALAELMTCCSAATFGKGSTEVLDPSYRCALQLSPAHFLTNFHVADYDILDKIKRILALSPSDRNIRAVLYKLNIYPAGGHFKAHVDTPRGNYMFGSLVVCLPTSFQGGELVVRHAQSQVVFDLSTIGQKQQPNEEEEKGAERESKTTRSNRNWASRNVP